MIDHPGVRLMYVEMARQCHDALDSMQNAKPGATRVAQAARDTGRVVLYGIGGSHYVNRMVEPLYREAGIECRAMSPSEALMAPLPDAGRVALYVSQSGESGEIVELLRRPAAQDDRYGVTLNADSTLGRSVKLAMVGAGGPENAFAATRSLVLTLAIHGAILEALGQEMDALRAVFAADAPADIDLVDAALVGSEVILFSGRHVMQGVAQSAALSLMELARLPAIGLELGQFRHGPFEFLRPGVATVLLRSAGPDYPSVAPVAQIALDAGCTTVVFDAANGKLPAGCVRLALPRSVGLAAAAHMLLALQRLTIAVAIRRIPSDVGIPLRTSKVTL